ncbi:nimC3 [Drosophila busckii]|uniref:NimC3 n=1 Tax=Drosophila busckii TaxID=30019 RepID=A0A0M3QTW5_DROBS|nr:epidermal growth factor-like protein 8 [Drosophila busckii]ALC39623.1 nimC3 [Drosophila busckii]
MLALCTLTISLMLLLLLPDESHSMAITNGHCQKNISVKYQVPVTKTKTRLLANVSAADADAVAEQYVVYEERVRWDTVQVCCPGYRTIIFGFCEPICVEACPAHSYCVEPNKCHCMRGYEHSHHANKQHQFSCRPICAGGCPEHSHCVYHNECECRPGYKDMSSWFSLQLRCERVQCGQEQRYDTHRRACVKIEMSMEELMQKVAERLAQGLEAATEAVSE